MNICRYTKVNKPEWDNLVKESKNGTFLFLRDYMDYHSDRFEDYSLMYYDDKKKLLAVMPANRKGSILYSHQGLTYGGLVYTPKVRMHDIMEMFGTTIAYLRKNGFSEWYYKQIPTCYHRYPSQGDEYALWMHGAELVACGVSEDVLLNDTDRNIRMRVSVTRRRHCTNLLRNGYTIERNADIKIFWPILQQNLLQTYGAQPVHTLQEIELLQKRFPDNIECVVARNHDGEIESGTVLFKMDHIVRTQYLSSTIDGKKNSTMDFLLLTLIENLRADHAALSMLDFGTSMNEDGITINNGLISQKEQLGGNAIAYKQYKMTL